jgi:hypothetical protein
MSKLTQPLIGVVCVLMLYPAAVRPAAQGNMTGKRDARDYMVLGCVGADASRASTETRGQSPDQRRFLITDSRSKSDIYRLDGDSDQLAFHVGHTIEVTGSLSGLTPPAGRGERAPLPTLKVKSLIYISSSCPR